MRKSVTPQNPQKRCTFHANHGFQCRIAIAPRYPQGGQAPHIACAHRPPLGLPLLRRPKHSPPHFHPFHSKNSIDYPLLSQPGSSCCCRRLCTVVPPLSDLSRWSVPPSAPHQPACSRFFHNGTPGHSTEAPQFHLHFQVRGGIESWDDGSEFPIESILNFRRANTGLELLVRWQDYDYTYISWERDANVLDRTLVRRFLHPTPS